MYLIVTASLVLVPILLGGTVRAAPVGAVATTSESLQENTLVSNGVTDITERQIHDQPYPPDLPPVQPPVLHVPPPHIVDPPRFGRHRPYEKRSAGGESSQSSESNVKLQPTKRWGGYEGGWR